jgi:hypothetical protein
MLGTIRQCDASALVAIRIITAPAPQPQIREVVRHPGKVAHHKFAGRAQPYLVRSYPPSFTAPFGAQMEIVRTNHAEYNRYQPFRRTDHA